MYVRTDDPDEALASTNGLLDLIELRS